MAQKQEENQHPIETLDSERFDNDVDLGREHGISDKYYRIMQLDEHWHPERNLPNYDEHRKTRHGIGLPKVGDYIVFQKDVDGKNNIFVEQVDDHYMYIGGINSYFGMETYDNPLFLFDLQTRGMIVEVPKDINYLDRQISSNILRLEPELAHAKAALEPAEQKMTEKRFGLFPTKAAREARKEYEELKTKVEQLQQDYEKLHLEYQEKVIKPLPFYQSKPPRYYDAELGLNSTAQQLISNAIMGVYKGNPQLLHRIEKILVQAGKAKEAEYVHYLEEFEHEDTSLYSIARAKREFMAKGITVGIGNVEISPGLNLSVMRNPKDNDTVIVSLSQFQQTGGENAFSFGTKTIPLDKFNQMSRADFDSFINDIVSDQQQGVIVSGKYGDNISWEIDDSCTLTISGSDAMPDGEYAPWRSYAPHIKNVVIETGVASVGEEAFSNFVNLTSIVLPHGIKSIGERAFEHCPLIQNIQIPDGTAYIAPYAFAFCSNLQNITLPESVWWIDNWAFHAIADNAVITTYDPELLVPGANIDKRVNVINALTTEQDLQFILSNGITCRLIDRWRDYYAPTTYTLGQNTEDATFYHTKVTESGKTYEYEFDHKPTREAVESHHINRHESEYGADGRSNLLGVENTMTDTSNTDREVETNLGKIPLVDYLNLYAGQHGFDSYDDLYHKGWRVQGYEDVTPESLSPIYGAAAQVIAACAPQSADMEFEP